jgi:hypothetical protein
MVVTMKIYVLLDVMTVSQIINIALDEHIAAIFKVKEQLLHETLE